MLLLVLVGTAGLGSLAAPAGATASSVPATTFVPSPAAPAVQPALTHGDLIVTSGEVFTIQPTLGGHTYFQGGNVSVQSGGTLIVRNVTLSFVQFVGDAGTAQSRLSHIVHFVDAGTVQVYNSTITTDAAVLNAYVKLNITVTGTMTLWNSALAFPGWVTATGPGAALTLNSSLATPNPSIAGLNEPSAILGDTMYAPSLTAEAGAALNLFNSTLNATYADDTQFSGMPDPAPLNASNVGLPSNVTSLTTPNNPANLTQDWLYPGGIGTGFVGVWYNTTGVGAISVFSVTVWYAGVGYALGTLRLVNDTSGGFATANFTVGLINAINAAGMLNYLNYTGAFGSASRIAVNFALSSGPAASVAQVRFTLLPPLDYNVVVTGSGSVLNAVDSVFNLTWNAQPLSPWSSSSPFPWGSNKLLVQDGATAYLANASVTSLIPGVFSTSAIVPDATSTVYFYRWADLNLTGRGGSIPIYGASVSTFYAYPSSQSNNATANGLNNLATADPAIWSYVQYRDTLSGLPAYATSGRSGVASVLVASSILTGTTIPDGVFVGAYHFGVLLPIPTNNSRWFNWSVAPFPVGVALGTPGYAGPDFGPDQHFPQYFAGATLSNPAVTTNGTGAGPRIGQVITFTTTVTSVGPAPITTAVASLIWGNTTNSTLLDTTGLISVPLVHQDANYTFALSWLISQEVTGLVGAKNATFTVQFVWNPGNVSGISGVVNATQVILVDPSQVVILASSLPPSTLDLNDLYITPGALFYNGSGEATIFLTATPSGGGAQVIVAEELSLQGKFTLSWASLEQLLAPGTTYVLTLEATYNGVTATDSFPGTYSVPSTTSPTSWLNYSFLGLTIWPYWILIIGLVVAGLIGFLLFSRRQAAGKLVECGECGNLIPEDATICPKCGAEFEADLIRCSRCSSTIPANSKVCPECAALLLGTSEEAGEAAERQGYQDYTEKYRAEGKRELGENFNEGSFWDWWKRQPTYTPFNQWKLQQGQGTPRTGMSEPPAAGGPLDMASAPPAPSAPPAGGKQPPKGGAGAMAPPPGAPPASKSASAAGASSTPATGSAPAAAGFKNCPGCGKEIPGDYLICPFCSSVVQ